MLEVMVLSLCIGQYECPTALKAYYNERPHLKAFVKKKKRSFQHIVGEKAAYALPAAAVIAAGGTAQFRISSQFSCGGGPDKFLCLFSRSF